MQDLTFNHRNVFTKWCFSICSTIFFFKKVSINLGLSCCKKPNFRVTQVIISLCDLKKCLKLNCEGASTVTTRSSFYSKKCLGKYACDVCR